MRRRLLYPGTWARDGAGHMELNEGVLWGPCIAVVLPRGPRFTAAPSVAVDWPLNAVGQPQTTSSFGSLKTAELEAACLLGSQGPPPSPPLCRTVARRPPKGEWRMVLHRLLRCAGPPCHRERRGCTRGGGGRASASQQLAALPVHRSNGGSAVPFGSATVTPSSAPDARLPDRAVGPCRAEKAVWDF